MQLFEKISIKYYVSLFLFLTVNLLFAVKYLSRVTSYYPVISIVIIGFYLLLWSQRAKLTRFSISLNKLNWGILLLYLVAIGAMLLKIPQEKLNVDRWSVITSFWDSFFDGQYAYYAKSHNGNPPGPMPFYFILALPFYFIGELGYFSLIGIVIFFLILVYKKKPVYLQSVWLVLCLASLFYLWEVICRSNLFLNSSLILLSIIIFLNSDLKKLSVIVLMGVMIGLLLSTRNVYIIPYIVCCLYVLKTGAASFKELLILGVIVLAIFILTFLPFVYGHLDDFLLVNPFIVQSSFLMPVEYSIFCVLLSFLSVFYLRKESDVYFFCGFLLFITIGCHFLYQTKEHGFEDSFFNSYTDISYFILCIPFLVYHMIEEEISLSVMKEVPLA